LTHKLSVITFEFRHCIGILGFHFNYETPKYKKKGQLPFKGRIAGIQPYALLTPPFFPKIPIHPDPKKATEKRENKPVGCYKFGDCFLTHSLPLKSRECRPWL